MLHYPGEASTYARRARLFIHLGERRVGILERGPRYYPYIEACTHTATACIDGFGEQQVPLLIAFARRDDMGWATGMLRTDAEGYLYSHDRQQAIEWLDRWVTNTLTSAILSVVKITVYKEEIYD
jgi:hypothetical protein